MLNFTATKLKFLCCNSFSEIPQKKRITDRPAGAEAVTYSKIVRKKNPETLTRDLSKCRALDKPGIGNGME